MALVNFSNLGTVERIIKATGGKLRTSAERFSSDLCRASIGFDFRKTFQTWPTGAARQKALKTTRGSTERLLKSLGADPNAALADDRADQRLETILGLAYSRIVETERERGQEGTWPLLEGWSFRHLLLHLRILRLAIIDAAESSAKPDPPLHEAGDPTYRQWLITDRLPEIFKANFEGGSCRGFVNACLVEIGLEPLSPEAMKKRNKRSRSAPRP